MNHKAYVFHQDRFWVVDGVRYFSELGFCLEVKSINRLQENFIPITKHNFFTEREVMEVLISKDRGDFEDQPSLLIE